MARLSQQRDVKHNRKLHGVLSEVAEALGWETDEFKEFIVTKLRPLDECPMTGFVRSTVSPSSSSMRRSTPCVLGCCGPMLMIIV